MTGLLPKTLVSPSPTSTTIKHTGNTLVQEKLQPISAVNLRDAPCPHEEVVTGVVAPAPWPSLLSSLLPFYLFIFFGPPLSAVYFSQPKPLLLFHSPVFVFVIYVSLGNDRTIQKSHAMYLYNHMNDFYDFPSGPETIFYINSSLRE